MSDVFRTAENRILAKRVKGKFTNPVEDIANVRVLSSGVASVAGQVYDSDTGGYRAGAVVEAVNVGTKGNARYVAKVANGGLDEAAIRRIVKGMLGDFLHSNDFTSAIVAPTTTPTLSDIFRDSIGPISSTDHTITFTIPSTALAGDMLVYFTSNISYATSVVYPDGDWDEWIWESQYATVPPGTLHVEWPGVSINVGFRKVQAGDIGTDKTFTYKFDYEGDPPTNAVDSKPIFYGVLLKRDFWNYVGYPSDWPLGDYDWGYVNVDANSECGAINTANQVLFYFRMRYEGAAEVAPLSSTVLCNYQANGTSLFVAAKLVALDAVATYPTDLAVMGINGMLTAILTY